MRGALFRIANLITLGRDEREIVEDFQVHVGKIIIYERAARDQLYARDHLGLEDMVILACGTSYHAALVGKYIIENLVRIPVRVELASEYNYGGVASRGSKAVVITQSGETADALKSIKRLKEEGCREIGTGMLFGIT